MFQKKGVGTRRLVFLAASLDYYTIPPATKAIKHYFNVRFFQELIFFIFLISVIS